MVVEKGLRRLERAFGENPKIIASFVLDFRPTRTCSFEGL